MVDDATRDARPAKLLKDNDLVPPHPDLPSGAVEISEPVRAAGLPSSGPATGLVQAQGVSVAAGGRRPAARAEGTHAHESKAARRQRVAYRSVLKLVREGGLQSIAETKLGHEVGRWTAEVTADLGGDLSAAQRTVLGHAAIKHAVALLLGAALAKYPDLVFADGGPWVAPIVDVYLKTSRALTDDLKLLGLRRVAKDQSVSDWLKEIPSESPSKES